MNKLYMYKYKFIFIYFLQSKHFKTSYLSNGMIGVGILKNIFLITPFFS